MNFKPWAHRQLFQPNWLGVFVNPLFITRYFLFKEIKKYSANISGKVLDFGCGTRPYENLFAKSTSYVGLDLEGSTHTSKLVPDKKADYYYSGGEVPFENEFFDSVVCFEMIDDVPDPLPVLSEIHRILRPGGYLLISSSFVWQIHELPNDYMRYTMEGLCHYLSRVGFEVTSQSKTGNFGHTISQLAVALTYEKWGSRNMFLFAITQILFSAPLTLAGILITSILKPSKSVYLGNVVLAKKL